MKDYFSITECQGLTGKQIQKILNKAIKRLMDEGVYPDENVGIGTWGQSTICGGCKKCDVCKHPDFKDTAHKTKFASILVNFAMDTVAAPDTRWYADQVYELAPGGVERPGDVKYAY